MKGEILKLLPTTNHPLVYLICMIWALCLFTSLHFVFLDHVSLDFLLWRFGKCLFFSALLFFKNLYQPVYSLRLILKKAHEILLHTCDHNNSQHSLNTYLYHILFFLSYFSVLFVQFYLFILYCCIILLSLQ